MCAGKHDDYLASILFIVYAPSSSRQSNDVKDPSAFALSFRRCRVGAGFWLSVYMHESQIIASAAAAQVRMANAGGKRVVVGGGIGGVLGVVAAGVLVVAIAL